MPELVSETPPTQVDLLNEAEALVRAYCGWHIAPARDEVVTVESIGGPALVVPSLQVGTVHSITIEGELLTEDDYVVLPHGVLMHRGGNWPVGVAEVSMNHGFSAVPELAGVIRSVAARAVTGATGYVQVGQVRVATGPGGAPLGGTLTEADRTVLDRYRLPARP